MHTNTNTNILLIQTSSQIISNVIWSCYHQIAIWSYGPYLRFSQLLTCVTIALFGVYRHDLAWVFVQIWPWWYWWIHASLKSFRVTPKNPHHRNQSIFQFWTELRFSWGLLLESSSIGWFIFPLPSSQLPSAQSHLTWVDYPIMHQAPRNLGEVHNKNLSVAAL